MYKRTSLPKREKGQSLPIVIIMGATMGILSMTAVYLFQNEVKFLVKNTCIMEKQELASIALEHVTNKLQTGSNWSAEPSDLDEFYEYSHEFTTSSGNYTVHIVKGNLFLTDINDPDKPRQGEDEYRTIGIKVKTKNPPSNPCKGRFYAVLKRVGFGGPLIAKGKVELPVNDDILDNDGNSKYSFFWGDIFCGNPNDDYCWIPSAPSGKGDTWPQHWMPHVYAKGDIYTAVGATESGGFFTSYADYSFAYTKDPLTPTAHCHPYSEFAQAPDLDFDYFKMVASEQGSYYGPEYLIDGSSNPYYCGKPVSGITDGTYDIDDLTSAVPGGLLQPINQYLFIDTTNALPISSNASGWNTYNGKITATANGDGSDGTIRWYKSDSNQKYTKGNIFIMGPLVIVGDDPDHGGDADRITTGPPPDNYYFPQDETDDNDVKWNYDATETNCYIDDVKHHGFIYTGGELRIGGTRGSSTDSYIVILGTLYVGEFGRIKVDRTNDDPTLEVYYDKSLNMFGFTGSSVVVMSFNEFSWLVPTPNPIYPESF